MTLPADGQSGAGPGAGVQGTNTTPAGWDCHVHVFDAAAPVRPGHYQPEHRPLHDIEALSARHGIGRLVLIQPSVYGTDNSVLLHALAAGKGKHRGVAVVDTSVDDQQLDRLHEAGVRGVRFNLVSPAGHTGDWAADLRLLAPRLHERGWHVQWYVHADVLPRLVPLQAGTGLRFVLDHLAGLHTELNNDDPAWAAAQALAAAGAWVKLSGWYRLRATTPYAALHPAILRAAAMFAPHCVWGSDWPHTSFTAGESPSYDSNLAPLEATLGQAALDTVLRKNPLALYR